jgi:transcriptional regulator with XRE-family HTH domain
MNPVTESLGQTIRERRIRLRLSQAKVAELTGKTQSQIARLERDLGDPRISSVVQVYRSLGTELVAIPIRLLPAVRHLLAEHEQGAHPPRSAKLVGNDPEDAEGDGDE